MKSLGILAVCLATAWLAASRWPWETPAMSWNGIVLPGRFVLAMSWFFAAFCVLHVSSVRRSD